SKQRSPVKRDEPKIFPKITATHLLFRKCHILFFFDLNAKITTLYKYYYLLDFCDKTTPFCHSYVYPPLPKQHK
ncbi:TPA: hypothetical protein ACNV4I_005560, partial [Serratia marcescens]